VAFLSEQEKQSLIATIKHAESGTEAEIVTVIAEASDGYRYIPTLWAALIALSIPGLHYLWSLSTSGGWAETEQSLSSSQWLYPIQVLVFFGLCLIFLNSKLRVWMIPTSIKHQRAARHAREQFFLQNLHETQGRTGILLFVSVAEHYVEIIVDTAIADVVNNDTWSDTVNDFIKQVRNGNIAEGFEQTIEHCRVVTWEHFPTSQRNPDELPNHLIEV